ncbi:cytochrome c oxidase subunit 7A1, mitochondrial-like [Penaeus japonicus]|uniref:cytochrome c oxidase subunit 7A1, mitochondrial-like n=1 Tax=Penaeus japonicus TaxID=27405 RepID=UPI001C716BDC|nr:cytochrome c oxidase subunit 7A1, mitochondrial-like [Penaeus japonicus]
MYEWRNSTGRLSTPGVQTPAKLGGNVEGPGIIYPSGTTFPKDPARGRGNFSEVPGFLADKMKMFQKPSGIPIHLKGGPLDKVIFGATVAMCVVGLTGCLSFFYDMSFPKKSAD